MSAPANCQLADDCCPRAACPARWGVRVPTAGLAVDRPVAFAAVGLGRADKFARVKPFNWSETNQKSSRPASAIWSSRCRRLRRVRAPLTRLHLTPTTRSTARRRATFCPTPCAPTPPPWPARVGFGLSISLSLSLSLSRRTMARRRRTSATGGQADAFSERPTLSRPPWCGAGRGSYKLDPLIAQVARRGLPKSSTNNSAAGKSLPASSWPFGGLAVHRHLLVVRWCCTLVCLPVRLKQATAACLTGAVRTGRHRRRQR